MWGYINKDAIHDIASLEARIEEDDDDEETAARQRKKVRTNVVTSVASPV